MSPVFRRTVISKRRRPTLLARCLASIRSCRRASKGDRIQNDVPGALQEYERSLKVRATSEAYIHRSRVWLTLGTLQLYLQEPQSVDSIQRAKEIDYRDTRNRLLLARAYLMLTGRQDNTLALDEAKNAIAFHERGDPRYNRILAQAHMRNREFEDAARHADAAVQGGDEPAYGHLISAIARAQTGDAMAAQKHLDDATKNWPEEFTNGEDVIVLAEKGLLWFDTAAELQALRAEAEQLLQTSAASP